LPRPLAMIRLLLRRPAWLMACPAAWLVTTLAVGAQQPGPASNGSARAVPPPPINNAAETVIPPAAVEVAESGRYGADVMVDVAFRVTSPRRPVIPTPTPAFVRFPTPTYFAPPSKP
jgi:hypothetical protein